MTSGAAACKWPTATASHTTRPRASPRTTSSPSSARPSASPRARGSLSMRTSTWSAPPSTTWPPSVRPPRPRDLERDVALAEDCGALLVLSPSTEEMYQEAMATTVSVGSVSEGLEGALRPTHFAGVATVVTKLHALAGPCRAYLGEKDFQQLAVIRRLVRDLSFPVEVVGVATVREPDGLAMSSRNAYLTDEERVAATVLHRALGEGVRLVEGGERDPAVVRDVMRAVIEAEPRAAIDYAEVVRADDLSAPDTLSGEL